MATFYSPKAVTSGLVLYLDAGNTKSNTGSGTTWYNLAGSSYNATLGSSVSRVSTFGGGLSFTNSAAAANMTITGSISFSYTEWTYEIIMTTSGSAGSDPTGIFGIIDSGGVTSNGFRSAGTYTQYSASGSWVNLSTFNSNLNTISQRTIVKNNTSLKQYNNGALYSSDTMGAGTGTITTYAVNSHSAFSAINSQDGIVYIVRIYNRALTDSEILQNYNAIKGRFGL